MPNAKYNLVQDGDSRQVTLYYDGETYLADNTHPRWDDIFNLVVVDDNPTDAVELFDIARLLRRKIVSERVTVTFNSVLFDNDPVHDALADHIVRLVNEGEDVTAWVKLLENIKLNPNPGSVEQLYRHLSRFQYTVTQDGMILAYKGVYDNGDGTYKATRTGHAIVNGEEINGTVNQKIGDVVEMPRSEVTFDPTVSCSYGLHVADWNYARGMGSVVLGVLVNPRDVVSVPNHYGDAKVRVCRYKVLDERTEPYSGAVLNTEVTVSVEPETPIEDPDIEPVYDSEGTELEVGDYVSHVNGDYEHVGRVIELGVQHPTLAKATVLVRWRLRDGSESDYNGRTLRSGADPATTKDGLNGFEAEYPDFLYTVYTDLEIPLEREVSEEPEEYKPQVGDRVYFADPEDPDAKDNAYLYTGTVDSERSDGWFNVRFDGFDEPFSYPATSLRPLNDTVDSDSDDNDESSASETTEEADVALATDAPVRYRYPSPAKFDEIVSKAKAQKKGVRRFIEARTNWSLIEGRGDGSSRKDWQV